MSENTKIEWADHSWSPWRGCTKVSAGCANCYAEGLANRFGAQWGGWGKGKPRVLAKNWKDPVKWNRNAAEDLRCVVCGATRFNDAVNADGYCAQCELEAYPQSLRVFPSLCDWLDDEVPIEWLARFLGLIQATPNLDWLLLTKRPENWYRRIYNALLHVEGITDPNLTEDDPQTPVGQMLNDWLRMDGSNAPRNVWIGTSVEDHPNAERRIPALLQIPAKLRFVSVEPMLGPVDFGFPSGASTDVKFPDDFSAWSEARRNQWFKATARATYIARCEIGIHWVIFGGESGPDARPFNVDWIRDGVKQCSAAGVACFVKQLGSHTVQSWDDPNIIPAHFRVALKHPKGGDPDEWPEDLRVRQMPGGQS